MAALSKLHDELADDSQLYASDSLQDQRDAVAHALLAVIGYLQAQGFSNMTLAPLMRPVSALNAREQNSRDMMFAERARAGRPSATSADHERMGILAALAEAWLRIHVDEDRTQAQLLAEAARQMKGRWFGDVTRANLKTARDLCMQESSDHPAVSSARLFYSEYLAGAEKFGPMAAFKIMIRMLNDVKLPFGAGEGGISKTPHVSPTDDD
ncbi:hypothetical protein IP68_03900 [Blastomonas sp. AAP25]|nr:hypothetical protein IP68_03900 [Blastomonas sp. AAP25]